MISRPDPTTCCCCGNSCKSPTCGNDSASFKTSSGVDGAGAVLGALALFAIGVLALGATSDAGSRPTPTPTPLPLPSKPKLPEPWECADPDPLNLPKLPPGKPVPLEIDVRCWDSPVTPPPESSDVPRLPMLILLFGAAALVGVILGIVMKFALE